MKRIGLNEALETTINYCLILVLMCDAVKYATQGDVIGVLVYGIIALKFERCTNKDK